MRVVALTPSITETLIGCDIVPVGRTRFCIHPDPLVKSITSVGGTKRVNINKLVSLNADLVIFDESENTKEDFESYEGEKIAVHIRSLGEAADEFSKLSKILSNEKLKTISDCWKKHALAPKTPRSHSEHFLAHKFGISLSEKQFIYLIWENPLMAVGRNTFIHSVMEYLGLENYFSNQDGYFEIENKDLLFKDDNVGFLLSTEPYPFKTKHLGVYPRSTVVDGEAFSWYGLRTLRFLDEFADSHC